MAKTVEEIALETELARDSGRRRRLHLAKSYIKTRSNSSYRNRNNLPKLSPEQFNALYAPRTYDDY